MVALSRPVACSSSVGIPGIKAKEKASRDYNPHSEDWTPGGKESRVTAHTAKVGGSIPGLSRGSKSK